MQKKILKTIALICVVVFGFSVQVFAQQNITVKGIIYDENNATLPGATISVKGTTIGTTADPDGKFTIQVPASAKTLVVSFIGKAPQNVPITAGLIKVNLVTSATALNEVVVVGYGTAKKADLSGATISVSQDKIKGTVVSNLAQALQGRAAGVTALYNSGQPGASVQINIRGTSTLLAGSTQPLYVVDGVPVQNVSQSGAALGLADRLGNGTVSPVSGLANINPNDILTMEILKDASATAIYGSQGANGVVLITTKRGKAGDAKFSYEGSYGIQEQVKRINVMNLREFAQFSNDWAAETAGRDPRIEFMDPSILGEGTNWQNEVFQAAPISNHQLSAQGGTDKVRYFVSGGYFKQDGTVIGSSFNRASARINLDADLKKWFKIGSNISLSQSHDQVGLNNSTEGIISVALNSTPDVPVKNADGTWAGLVRENAPSVINPIAKALDERNELKRNDFNGNIFTDITFLKGLTLRSELGGSVNITNAYQFIPTYQYGSLVNNTNSIARQYNQNYFWQLKNYLTYSSKFGKHNVSGMIGQEASEYKYEYLRGSGSNLSSNDIQEPGLADPTTMRIGSGDGSGALASVFARATYNYADKYYATYTYRYDGSSNFGPENRWAPFNSFAVSWRVSGESFMQNNKLAISNLKLRLGWGQTGNQNIGGYRWGAAIGKMPSNLGQGYRQLNIANPYIKWEKQVQTNLGVDLGFFENRINLTVDMYKKISKGFLMNMQLPSYMGTSGNGSIRLNPPMGNFGEIENTGLEFSLNTRPFVGKFSYENDFQLTFNKNKLIALTGLPAAHLEGYGQWTDLVSLTNIGDPLFNFYGYKVVGVYKDKQDILDSPKQKAYPANGDFKRSTVWPGDLKFADVSGPDGKPDGVIDEYDRTYIGSPQPKFTYGFNNSFRYMNFELNIFINGSYGNKIMNYVGRNLTTMTGPWSNTLQTMVDRSKLEPIDASKSYPFVNSFGSTIYAWYDDIENVRVMNPGTDIPRAAAGDPNENSRISDRYVEDGSYLRFKNISLAYNIPKEILKKAYIENLKVYCSIQNLWTITKYTGFDPEIGASQTSDNVMGLDNGRYPSPRIYTFGINLSF